MISHLFAGNNNRKMFENKSDNEIVEIVKKETELLDEAFKELYERNKKKIFKTILVCVKNFYDCEDIFQNTFLKAFKNLNNFRGKCSFSTWLYRICFNLIADFRKKEAREKEVLEEYGQKRKKAEKEFEDIVHHKKLIEIIRNEINKLPEKMKNVYVMKSFSLLNATEIARILAVSERYVRKLLSKAEQIIRENVADKNYG